VFYPLRLTYELTPLLEEPDDEPRADLDPADIVPIFLVLLPLLSVVISGLNQRFFFVVYTREFWSAFGFSLYIPSIVSLGINNSCC
jgi:hypothetical protein